MMAELLKARESFTCPQGSVGKDELISADDPIVKGREHAFAPVEASKSSTARVAAGAAEGRPRGRGRRTEQATANPGERRSITPPPPPDDPPPDDPPPPAP